MAGSDTLDLANLPRFLVHLEERQPGFAALVRQLLDAGWQVQSFWGPVQMDVWSLRLRRDELAVIFGIERGVADGVQLGPVDGAANDFRPLSYAVLAWARALGVDVPLTDPDEFRPDVGAHGLQTINWLRAGNLDVIARVNAAWAEYWSYRYSKDQLLGELWLAETKARGIELIEAASGLQR